MPIPTSEFQKGNDVYFKYEFEDSVFRYESSTGMMYTKFSGKPERTIDPSTTLATEARLGGELITQEEYFTF